MNTKNILLYTLGHKDQNLEINGYKIPVACGGMEKNILYNLNYLKKHLNVNLILFGLRQLPSYDAQGINIIPGGETFNSYTLSYIFSFKDLATKFPFNIKDISEQKTIILVHNYFLFVIFSKLLKPKFKVILFLESNSSELLWRPFGNFFSKIMYMFITLVGLILADKIVKNTNKMSLIEEKAGFIKKKLYFLPNAIDMEVFKPCEGTNSLKPDLFQGTSKVLLYIGRIYDLNQKNPQLLFDSFKIIQKEVPGIKLIIISPNSSYSKQLLGLLKIKETKNIYFIGPFANESLVPYYQYSNLTLLTSNMEGTPYVILESLACGTPCVSTDVLDKGIIVDNINGYICKSKNPVDFAKSILKGLKLSENIKPLRKNLLEEKFDPRTREDSLQAILSGF